MNIVDILKGLYSGVSTVHYYVFRPFYWISGPSKRVKQGIADFEEQERNIQDLKGKLEKADEYHSKLEYDNVALSEKAKLLEGRVKTAEKKQREHEADRTVANDTFDQLSDLRENYQKLELQVAKLSTQLEEKEKAISEREDIHKKRVAGLKTDIQARLKEIEEYKEITEHDGKSFGKIRDKMREIFTCASEYDLNGFEGILEFPANAVYNSSPVKSQAYKALNEVRDLLVKFVKQKLESDQECHTLREELQRTYSEKIKLEEQIAHLEYENERLKDIVESEEAKPKKRKKAAKRTVKKVERTEKYYRTLAKKGYDKNNAERTALALAEIHYMGLSKIKDPSILDFQIMDIQAGLGYTNRDQLNKYVRMPLQEAGVDMGKGTGRFLEEIYKIMAPLIIEKFEK